jgi:signal transduction histidine kinase
LRRALLDAVDEERRQLGLELRSGPLAEIDDLARRLDALDDEAPAALLRELALAREELREIADGLHPGVLLEHGLAGALADIAQRSPVPVTVRLDVGEVPMTVALTAYYVSAEALANVAKHAGAAGAVLEALASDGQLVLRVSDDGVGGADPAGSGLSGLRDRVAAVDGSLRVASGAGGGTLVEARLPTSRR